MFIMINFTDKEERMETLLGVAGVISSIADLIKSILGFF